MHFWHRRFIQLIVLVGSLMSLVGITGMVGSSSALASPARPSHVAIPQARFEQQLTNQLVGLINSNRTSRGLPAYAGDNGLFTAAANHSALMADRGIQAHQLSGEASYVQRINHYTGYTNITAWGENIDGPRANSPAGLDESFRSMVNEGASGIHYQNLFSRTFTRFGAIVMSDNSNRIWVTEDFIRRG